MCTHENYFIHHQTKILYKAAIFIQELAALFTRRPQRSLRQLLLIRGLKRGQEAKLWDSPGGHGKSPGNGKRNRRKQSPPKPSPAKGRLPIVTSKSFVSLSVFRNPRPQTQLPHFIGSDFPPDLNLARHTTAHHDAPTYRSRAAI